MGQLTKHPGGIFTYQALGPRGALDGASTASLLLLAIQAVRLLGVHGKHARTAYRIVADVARGRRPQLTHDEMWAAYEPMKRWAERKEVSKEKAVGRLVYLAWDWHKRLENAPLGDSLARAVLDSLGMIAYLLKDDEPKRQRLHELEARCLIHHWTNTLEVIPDAVLRAALSQSTEAAARACALTWRSEPRIPSPQWTPPPPTQAEIDRRVARDLEVRAAAARWAAMTPEEREEADANRKLATIVLQGLFTRDVQ